MEQAAGSVARVSNSQPPVAMLQRFGPDGLELEVGFWIDDPENGRGGVVSDVNKALWRAFISITSACLSLSAKCASLVQSETGGRVKPGSEFFFAASCEITLTPVSRTAAKWPRKRTGLGQSNFREESPRKKTLTPDSRFHAIKKAVRSNGFFFTGTRSDYLIFVSCTSHACVLWDRTS